MTKYQFKAIFPKNNMVSKDNVVKEWISHQRKSGVSNEKLKDQLIKRGYPESVANKLLRKSYLWIILAVFVAIVCIAGIMTYRSYSSCQDQACFISLANECKNARFQQIEAGSLFTYTEKNCALTKTLTKMNETEPAEMKTLLEGKSMTCDYVKGMFDINWINTLSKDIEVCSGELKDSISEILYSV